MNYRQNFNSLWIEESEETIIDLDWNCGSEFDEEIGYNLPNIGYNLPHNYLNNGHLNRNI